LTEGKRTLAQLCVGVSLCFGSLADEAAQVIFALCLASNTSSVFTLLAAGLIGGILAGPIAPRVLSQIGPIRTISLVFILESGLIAVAALSNQFLAYIAVSTVLGCIGLLLWTAIMVIIPSFAQNNAQMDIINRMAQSVRYSGYIGGPAIGGIIYQMANGSQGMLSLALLVFLVATVTMICFKALKLNQINAGQPNEESKRRGLDLLGLLRTKGVVRAVCPLIITVILTSALNVLLIIRVRNDLQLSAETYGLIVSTISIGLMLGPLTLSGMFSRIGDAAGASMAAAIIGLGISWLASATVTWTIICATLIIGAANGVQNTLMSSFMMKTITQANRIHQMPAYVLCIQTSVFIGFITAGFVKNSQISDTLMLIGIVTATVGVTGVALNVRNTPRDLIAGAK
jgi:MFS family permease